jgi:hypothetical protein
VIERIDFVTWDTRAGTTDTLGGKRDWEVVFMTGTAASRGSERDLNPGVICTWYTWGGSRLTRTC